jgi:TP901 family phage tail tape measure protein
MSGAVAPVDVAIKVKGLSELQKLAARMEALEKEITRLQGKLPKTANGIAATGRAAKGAAGGVGVFGAALKSAVAPLALVLGSVTSLTVGFQKLSQQNFAEAKFRSLGGDSEELTKNLRALSKELKSTSSVDLTAAAYDVASAGFIKAADATKVLKASALGAKGGFSDINTVANATTSVLNAYGLSADKAGRLVDGFIQTQNDGKIVIGEYANNIGKLAPIAASLGVPLEDINGAIAAVTANGINAEIGITALRSALAKLGSNSNEATDLLASYGVEINATTIGNEGLLKTLQKLQKVTDKTDLLKIIGTEAGQAIAPLLNDLGKLERLIANQGNVAGVAANAQKQAANTIQGAYAQVQTAFSNLFSEQSELAEAIIPILQGVADAVNALNSPLGGAILQVGLLTGGFIALNAAVSALVATSFVQWFLPIVGAVKAGNLVFAAFILKTKALTAVQIVLKGVMASMPWAAAAIAIGFVATKTYEAIAAQKSFEEALASTDRRIVQSKINELTKQLEGVKEAADKATPSMSMFGGSVGFADVKIAHLTGKIVQLKQELAGLSMPAIKGFDTLTDEQIQEALALVKPEEIKLGGGDSGGAGGGAGAAPKTDNLEALQRQIDLSKDLLTFEGQKNKELLAGNDIAVARIDGEIALRELQASGLAALEGLNTEEGRLLQTQQNQLDVAKQLQSTKSAADQAALAETTAIEDALRPLQEQKRILEATLNGRGEEERLLIQIENIMKNLPKEQKEVVEGLIRGNAELTKQAEQAAELKALYAQVSQRIQSGIVDGIVSAIDGTKELSEILADVLKDVGKMFLQFAVKSAFSGMGFADGGRPPMNQVSLIGERGPELFVPDSAGTIISNEDAFEAARDALTTGSSETTSMEQDSALSDSRNYITNNSYSSEQAYRDSQAAIMSSSATTERTIERQMLEQQLSNPSAIKLDVETTVINSVEYLTVQQGQKMSDAAAKKARGQVFSDLKNRPSSRRQVGLR